MLQRPAKRLLTLRARRGEQGQIASFCSQAGQCVESHC